MSHEHVHNDTAATGFFDFASIIGELELLTIVIQMLGKKKKRITKPR